MSCAVDRLGFAPGQALTPSEALDIYTTGGARARRSEDRVGSLAPGLRADLVELEGDLDVAIEGLEVTAPTCAGVDLYRRAG